MFRRFENRDSPAARQPHLPGPRPLSRFRLEQDHAIVRMPQVEHLAGAFLEQVGIQAVGPEKDRLVLQPLALAARDAGFPLSLQCVGPGEDWRGLGSDADARRVHAR